MLLRKNRRKHTCRFPHRCLLSLAGDRRRGQELLADAAADSLQAFAPVSACTVADTARLASLAARLERLLAHTRASAAACRVRRPIRLGHCTLELVPASPLALALEESNHSISASGASSFLINLGYDAVRTGETIAQIPPKLTAAVRRFIESIMQQAGPGRGPRSSLSSGSGSCELESNGSGGVGDELWWVHQEEEMWDQEQEVPLPRILWFRVQISD